MDMRNGVPGAGGSSASLSREHNALGWVLGAQGLEESAAENCNKLLFPTILCVCMKEPHCTPIS